MAHNASDSVIAADSKPTLGASSTARLNPSTSGTYHVLEVASEGVEHRLVGGFNLAVICPVLVTLLVILCTGG